MRLFLTLALLVSFIPQIPENEYATVYVFMPPHNRMMKRAAVTVFMDDKALAELEGSRYFVAHLPPGKHAFHSKDKKKGGVEIDLKAKETYYLRVEMEHTGYFIKFNGISLVPNEQGTFSIKQLQPVKQKYIKDVSLVRQTVGTDQR
jgi:hypothetical protein